jgi:hypothetical protein
MCLKIEVVMLWSEFKLLSFIYTVTHGFAENHTIANLWRFTSVLEEPWSFKHFWFYNWTRKRHWIFFSCIKLNFCSISKLNVIFGKAIALWFLLWAIFIVNIFILSQILCRIDGVSVNAKLVFSVRIAFIKAFLLTKGIIY